MSEQVWIVEMWNDARNQWEPTVGIGLSRLDGRGRVKQWRVRNPGTPFRLRCYQRVGTDD